MSFHSKLISLLSARENVIHTVRMYVMLVNLNSHWHGHSKQHDGILLVCRNRLLFDTIPLFLKPWTEPSPVSLWLCPARPKYRAYAESHRPSLNEQTPLRTTREQGLAEACKLVSPGLYLYQPHHRCYSNVPNIVSRHRHLTRLGQINDCDIPWYVSLQMGTPHHTQLKEQYD